MCYSAQVSQSLRKLARQMGADVDYKMFDDLFAQRLTADGIDDKVKVARALEDSFQDPKSAEERSIKSSIAHYHERLIMQLQTNLLAQRERLAAAEQKLKVRETKTALGEQRKATDKVNWHLQRLVDLRRPGQTVEDTRIFPFWHAPVIVTEGDRKMIRPMRYHCRLPGKPVSFDRQYEGLYMARKDNLKGFWRHLFGTQHAILVINGFYENVARHDYERRELRPGEEPENLVLNFNPRPTQDMFVACLWSHWQAPKEQDLYSFAAVSDDPPPEIAAAGHNRCPIALKPDNVDAWLSPQKHSSAELLSFLADRQAPYYEHRIAA